MLGLGETHEVENQATALESINMFRADGLLRHLGNALADSGKQSLDDFGERCGTPDYIELGFLANENPPTFRTHDRYGRRVDLVKYHPSYHELMRVAFDARLHCLPWLPGSDEGHQLRAAMFYMQSQVEAGHGCPISMTFAARPSLSATSTLPKYWLDGISSQRYDHRNIPAVQKSGLTIGMAMTEKQGGSDVRANTTQATELTNGLYELNGHKYFMSAPMSDGFLVLAQTPQGLSSFLVPRWLDDGQKNGVFIQQLKRKLGNISNASCEVEFRQARGYLLGTIGQGISNIIEMVALTRFDCVVGSAAGMRAAAAQAIHHCRSRKSFGRRLIEHSIMTNVLADLAIESEAALALAMRLARALDQIAVPHEQAFLRIATGIAKYWVCKRLPQLSFEAMECIGGMGVMDDCVMPRLYREAPINAIWEGSGNIQCLDFLRVLQKEPQSQIALFKELGSCSGVNQRYDDYIDQLQKDIKHISESDVRRYIERLGIALQAMALLQSGREHSAVVFCEARLKSEQRQMYGTLPTKFELSGICSEFLPIC